MSAPLDDRFPEAAFAPADRVFEDRRLPGYLGVLALEADGTVKYVTPPLMARLGWAAEDWIGRNGFALLDDDDLAQAAQSFAGTTERSGYHQPLTLHVRGADSRRHEMVVVAENLLDDPRIGAVVLNVTASEEFDRAEVLAIHQAKVLELIARDSSLASTLDAIADLAESQIHGGRCVVMMGSGRTHWEVAAAPSLSPDEVECLHGIATDDEDFLATRAWRDSEALVVPDILRCDLTTTRRVAGDLDAAAVWSVPLAAAKDAPAMGALNLYHPDAVHPRPDEWSLLKLAARLVALAVEHDVRRSQLQRRAAFDPMTGLANRSNIEELLGVVLSRRDRGAVLFLDIDRLKMVNDNFGHAVGDDLIRAVGDRLREFQKPGVTVGRFGGDEFFMVLEPPVSDRVSEVAGRVLQRLRTPVRLGHRELSVTSSIGIARIYDGMSVDAVLRDADLAMYDAKAAGRDTVRICSDELRARAADRVVLESELRTAISDGDLEVHYQPVVDVATGCPISIEALSRWRSGGRWIAPDEFIPVAEDSGLIIPLGKQVLIRACCAARDLDAVVPGIRVAVNVSPLQLMSGQMSGTVASALEAAGLEPARLCLEITEAVMMSQDDAIIGELDTIRKLGVTIAIDDFGTGYSSLAYLRRLSVDTLKVDRAFIEDLCDEGGRAVLRLIGTVGRELGLRTIAEGVETADQWDAVSAAGIDSVQGYLVSRPKPFDELESVLAELVSAAAARREVFPPQALIT